MPLRVGKVQPLPLPGRFEEVHVDPAVMVGRGPGDALQGRVEAPLRADRSVLHPEPLALERGRDPLHLVHEVVGGVGAGKGRREPLLVHRVEVRQHCTLVAIREGVAVEDRARERDPDPDVRCRPRDPRRLVGEPVRCEGVVAVHGRADPGMGHPAEGDARFEPGIDGRPPGERCDPALEGVVGPAEGERPQPVAVVVGVHHRRQGEEILPDAALACGDPGLHRLDTAVLDLHHCVPKRGLPSGRGEEPAEPERAPAHVAGISNRGVTAPQP